MSVETAATRPATAVRPRSSTPWLIRAGLRLLVEGAWLSIAYDALAVVGDKRVPVLGPLELALLVGVGAAVARRTRRVPSLGAVLIVAVAAMTGLAGWLLVGQSLSALFPLFAVLRGGMIAADWDGVPQLESVLVAALPAAGLVWAATLVASEPALVASFSASALWSTLLLVAAGTLGVGWARLDQLQGSMVDQPTRRAWRLLVTVIGLAVVPLALPFGLASGIPVASVASPIMGFLQFAVGILLLPFYLLAGLLLTLLSLVFRQGTPLTDIQLPGAVQTGADPNQVAPGYTLLGIAIAVVTFTAIALVILIGVLVLARWMVGRETRTPPERRQATPDIERAIVRPTTVRPRAQDGGRRRVRPGRPREAVGAYLAALAEMEPFPAMARQPAETPARHATRLRASAVPVASDLGRLAADYQLVRYAGRPVSRAEDRRALSRFERLRGTLRSIAR